MNEFTKDNPLLMIPGPVQSATDVLSAFSDRAYSHTETKFVTSFQKALQNLRHVFAVSETYSPVVIAGGGTLAMEIAMINLVDSTLDERFLVCETGYFGDRFMTLADSLGVNAEKISAPVGSAISESELEDKLSTGNYDFACIQHVDTSTGVANDIEMFGRMCQKYDVISVVDGVCALGGQELKQEEWGIDIYLTGAQKALALPPGLAILMYSVKARTKCETRLEKIPSYYADLDNWWPILDAYLSGGVKYFSTPATNLIVGLYRATEIMLEEGMYETYKRHHHLANKFRSELEEMGFDFITNADNFANTLSTPKYKDPSKAAEFRAKLLEQGVLVAGGIQKGYADQYFRVGHMGRITQDEIDFTLQAIRKAIE